MSRKTIGISIIVAIAVSLLANLAYVYNYAETKIRTDYQCFQATVTDNTKPIAIVYQPSVSDVMIFKGNCETDVKPKAGKTAWTNEHQVQFVFAAITTLVLLVVFAIAALIGLLAPWVALYRWSFDDFYDDMTYWETLIYTIKH
jgi:hypothetical protein